MFEDLNYDELRRRANVPVSEHVPAALASGGARRGRSESTCWGRRVEEKLIHCRYYNGSR
jgi:hypothetical protein